MGMLRVSWMRGIRTAVAPSAALCLVLAFGLVLPASSSAGIASEYGGRLANDPVTFFGFDVQGNGDNRKLRSFLIVGLPFACAGDEDIDRASGPVTGKVKVRENGRFSKTVVDPQKGDVTVRLRLTGKLNGNRAAGKLDLRSRFPSGRCYSGTLPWKAKKPSPKPPLPRAPFPGF